MTSRFPYFLSGGGVSEMIIARTVCWEYRAEKRFSMKLMRIMLIGAYRHYCWILL